MDTCDSHVSVSYIEVSYDYFTFEGGPLNLDDFPAQIDLIEGETSQGAHASTQRCLGPAAKVLS